MGSLVGHVALIVVFLVWAGREAFGSFALPDPRWFLIGVAVVAALIALGFAIRTTRRLIVDRFLPPVRRAFDGLTDVLRSPSKVALLFGGSGLLTFMNLITMYLATVAFGGGLPFATVGAVYLVAAAIGTAAPTPGGLGAVEAALIAGLVAAGMDHVIAVPAVFLFRLATFWIPVLPGWVGFNWLQRNDHL